MAFRNSLENFDKLEKSHKELQEKYDSLYAQWGSSASWADELNDELGEYRERYSELDLAYETLADKNAELTKQNADLVTALETIVLATLAKEEGII